MNAWIYVILGIIGLVALGKVVYLIVQKRQTSTTTSVRQTTQAATVEKPNINETGPMIYYANDHHGRSDREYRFNYKRVYDSSFQKYSWRAYILKMPSLSGRDPDLHKTHRFTDGNGHYWVCWDSPVNSLKDMQTISRVWADSLQEYIASGKRFG